jgi:hypothetical protein
MTTDRPKSNCGTRFCWLRFNTSRVGVFISVCTGRMRFFHQPREHEENSDGFLARIRAVHTLARRVEGSRRSDRFTRRSNQQNNSQRRWWTVPPLEGDDGPKGGAYIKLY